MRRVEMFEANDGKLFHKESEAIIHEGLLVKVDEIVKLFGKQPDNEDYVIVPEVNLLKANELIEKLARELRLGRADITSRKVYNNDYMYKISYIKSSMKGNVRYNQPYFVENNSGEGKEIPFEA